MRPRVGITSWPRPVATIGPPEPNDTVPRAYVRAVQRAGGLPVLLPRLDPADIDELLAAVDGVVLTGGGDVDPGRYGADTAPETDGVDEERDAFELDLCRRLLETGLPTLAICRGIQVLNVALGGTLHQHTPDHRRLDGGAHTATIEAGSRLATVLGTTTLEVNSLHHQSIDRPGDGVHVVGRAADGIAEAVEIVDHPNVVAVQWHPELLRYRPEHLALFEDLVSRSGSH